MERADDILRAPIGRALSARGQAAPVYASAVVAAERGSLLPHPATQPANTYWRGLARALRRASGLFTVKDCLAADERSGRLLLENLSPAQRRQFAALGSFEVVGGKTGRRYRIRHGVSMNIEQLDEKGRRVCSWCFFPAGRLAAGDVMLAQKMALELFELEALAVANRF